MSKTKIKERLQLKTVDLEYLDQFDALFRYVFQVTSSELEEDGYDEGESLRSKRPILEKSDVFGWFDQDKLISQICIFPCQVNVHGNIYKMGGVTGIGTYPEYSGFGLVHELIKVSLNHMREKGQWLSYLYPYNIPFYRRKGWEIMSDHLTFTLKDSQIPSYPNVDGYVMRRLVDDNDVFKIYDLFSRSNHGALIRGRFEWDQYWRWENEEERIAAVFYDNNDNPMGYLIYWIANDIFYFKEMIYLNQEARRGLWQFIYAHYSMIDEVKGHIYKNESLAFLLDDSQIKEVIEPYFMARIIDVENFLKHYPFTFNAEPFHFIVNDPIADWNNGIFSVDLTHSVPIIGHNRVGKSVKLNIQTLTTMLMGYRRPSYLAKVEHLQADVEMIKVLEAMIPNQQPYFSDYF